MIVSTRRTAGGVEVVGIRAQDLPSGDELESSPPVQAPRSRDTGASSYSPRPPSEAPAVIASRRPSANLWDSIEDGAVRLSPAARVLAEHDRPDPYAPVPASDLPLARWPQIQEKQIPHLVRSGQNEYVNSAHALAVASADGSGPMPVLRVGIRQSESERSFRQSFGGSVEHASAVSADGGSAGELRSTGITRLDSVDKAELVSEVSEPIMTEMRSMRGWLERQMEVMTWRDATQKRPEHRVTWRKMVDAGFTPELARTVASRLPQNLSDAQAAQWLVEVLARNLPTVSDADSIVERGGRYVIVGPTGVGKTTTTAKIAAHCVVKYGASALGLITTDQHRIGAVDQLHTFGQILGVDVYAARGANDLEVMLASMADRRLVLIDSAGLSQRDDHLVQHLQKVTVGGVKRLLVMPAGAHAEQAEDIVQAYGAGTLAGIVISKLDEAVRLGGVLDAAIRHRVPLHYVTNGQRVPEDIHDANARVLVHRALRVRNAPAFALDAEELDWACTPLNPVEPQTGHEPIRASAPAQAASV